MSIGGEGEGEDDERLRDMVRALESAGDASDDVILELRTTIAERERRIQELEQTAAAQATELVNVKQAIETRDVIGMAMGIIIANLGCTPPEAFDILVKRSQNQNRKLHEICVEIVDRASHRGSKA